jgi:hypothetical protein
MSLASLFNVPQGSPDLDFFTIANEAEHNEVGRAVFDQMKVYIPPLLIRPLFPADQAGWLIRHSALHTQVNDVLRLGSNDLMVLDLQNPDTLREWIWLHATEHRQWRTSLRI